MVQTANYKTKGLDFLVHLEDCSGWRCNLFGHSLQRRYYQGDCEMTPYDWWLKMYEIWMELVFEVNALKNCRNSDKGEIEKIKALLIREGIWK